MHLQCKRNFDREAFHHYVVPLGKVARWYTKSQKNRPVYTHSLRFFLNFKEI